ncbi:MAG: ATP-binding protein [Candidatus Bathyarchaeia archaeon]
MSQKGVFDELDLDFEGRLREHRIVTKTFRGERGEISVTSATAIIESRFNFKVLDRLHDPCFLAIERETSRGFTYLIYEALAPTATHFQMLGMNVAMPNIVRREFLDTISSGWGKSGETWIDILAIPTRHEMQIVNNQPTYSRSRLTPLTGARAHILSREAVERFLCIKPGTEIGTLLGFNLPLTVDVGHLVRYHAGVFGFTGTGKSNLISYLLRKTLSNDRDLRVVIIDLAGEYLVHLMDIIAGDGEFYTTEECSDPEKLLSSQVVPETLEERPGLLKILEKCAERIVSEGRIHPINLARSKAITIDYLLTKLEDASSGGKTGATSAMVALGRLERLVSTRRLNPKIDLLRLSVDDRDRIVEILTSAINELHERSGLRSDLTSLVAYIGEAPVEDEETMDPSRLSRRILSGDSPRVTIIYLPEPYDARQATSIFVQNLLLLKKISSMNRNRRVLLVLDEAQEFIPDRVRIEDFTDASNRAVEALLRHGRKYRAHCWLSTQRVAHLNVNALHQLHSYFVSVLPRSYDRWVIAEAFSLDTALLDKTIDLETGEWLFVSYKATRQKNIPTFIKAPNNEDIIASRLNQLKP